MIEIDVRDADGFASSVATAAQIYGEAMARGPELVVQRREIMQSHLHRRGFVAVVATIGSDLVGFGYGYHGRAGEWWHDIVDAALRPDVATDYLTDAFELAELHLLPAWHGQGIGARMLTTLLPQADAPSVVLSTPDVESRARRLYRNAGFVDLLCGFVFPGSSEVYAVMGRKA